jgi:HK97 family phage major capsid protein
MEITMSFSINSANKRRYEVRTEAEQLINGAIKAKRDLNGVESARYDLLCNELQDLQSRIDRHSAGLPQLDAGDYASKIVTGESYGITSEGSKVRILAKGESVAEHVSKASGAKADFSLGDMLRSAVLGGGRTEVRAALSEGSQSGGGFLVPEYLSGDLIDKLRARSSVFTAGARTVILEAGLPTTIASIVTDPTATWKAENAAVNVSDLTFGSITFTPKTLAVVVVASRELVEDGLNLSAAITLSLTKSFAAELDRVALLGSGSGQEPKGVINISGVGSVSMGTNGLALASYDPFIQALGVLQTANAQDPTAVIINPRTAQEAALLKDSTGQPLRKPQAIENLPFLVTSKLPITETQGTASTASHAVMGYFPDLFVGVRTSLRIQVLQEKYADNNQVGFLATLRADIAVAHAASFANIVGIL